ncbi:MAG: ATP-dependent DNA helicase RecG, partial [Hymenobacter sp.]
PMSDAQYRHIINETEPDFSATACLGLTLADLSSAALARLKQLYARKQKNPDFERLPDRQVLSDLDLLLPGPAEQLTYAALLLVGSVAALKQYLPQAGINLEYRATATSITFQDRLILREPLFGGLDAAWDFINKRNGRIALPQGLYILDDIALLNEVVVREALLNAVAHRDYRRASEVVVHQSPSCLDVSSPGGFPAGVTEQNILTVNSTPRNRLLADVLLKTGLVERSGQGVDKIFRNSIVEAKGTPSYHRSDAAQVVLQLPALVEDPAFALFINYVQRELRIELTLNEVLTLEKVRQRVPRAELPEATVQDLARRRLIEPVGNTRARHFILAREYYQFTGDSAGYTLEQLPHETVLVQQVHHHLTLFPTGFKMGDMYKLLQGTLSSSQVKELIYRLRDQEMLDTHGVGRATTYTEGQRWRDDNDRLQRAVHLGIEQMKAQGEWPAESDAKPT